MQIYFDRKRYRCQDCEIEFEITQQTVNTEPWDDVTWDDVKHLNTETCKICTDTTYPSSNTSLWGKIWSKLCPPSKGVPCPQCGNGNTILLKTKEGA